MIKLSFFDCLVLIKILPYEINIKAESGKKRIFLFYVSPTSPQPIRNGVRKTEKTGKKIHCRSLNEKKKLYCRRRKGDGL